MTDYMQTKGTVFNIQRYSTDDGPGVRTTVFMKGCPLSCRWCANPESQSRNPQLLFRYTACKQCGKCVPACPENALSMVDGELVIDRDKCTACGACAKKCLYSALSVMGTVKTVEEVFNVVKRDKDYYDQGGGGCTCSGGEILSQADFVADLFRVCKENGIHTNADTSGYGSTEHMKRLMQYADMFYFDLKLLDPEKHREYTGVYNGIILDNLKLIAENKKETYIRVPLIPGVNNTKENLEALVKTVGTIIPDATVNFLPYHEYGKNKYKGIGKPYLMPEGLALTEEEKESAVEFVRAAGLKCKIS